MSRVQNISKFIAVSVSLTVMFLLASTSVVNADTHPDRITDQAREEHEGKKVDLLRDRIEARTDVMEDRMGQKVDSMTDRMVEKTDAMRMQMDQRREALHSRVETIKHNLADRVDTQRARVQEKASQLSERIEAKRMEMEERKAERQTKIAKHHQDRILEHVKRLIRRLTAAIERMEIMAGRIQSRIDKLVERGLDMTDEQALLDTALSHIASAQTDIDALEGAVVAMLDSEDPREAYSKVKELVRATIDSVKSAHKSLVEAIRSVKANHKDSTLDKDDDTDESTDTAS